MILLDFNPFLCYNGRVDMKYIFFYRKEMLPLDFSVLKNHPWNELITRARLGDTAAILALCELAEPVIKQYCRVPFFVRWLGREEVRSLAALAVLEFIMENPSVPRDSEVPCALKKVIKCQLLNRIKRLKIEDRHMYSAPSAAQRLASASLTKNSLTMELASRINSLSVFSMASVSNSSSL